MVKLSPFSLTGKAKIWYDQTVGRAGGDWIKLKDEICFPATKVFALGIASEESLLTAKSRTPHRIPEDAKATLRWFLEPFFSTYWSPYQLYPLTSTTYSGNYQTNQVHRLWATHLWYANAHHDLGHVSNMPKEHKCICLRSEAFILDATSQIEGLTIVISKEWIEGAEFNSWKLLCAMGMLHHKITSTIRRNSCPPVSTRSGSTARWWKVRRFFHVMSLKMGRNKIFLDLHIFDIPEGDKVSWSVSQ